MREPPFAGGGPWRGTRAGRGRPGLTGVTLIDLTDAICPTDPCAPVIGGVLVYRDDHHLTATYGAVWLHVSPPRSIGYSTDRAGWPVAEGTDLLR